MLNENDAYRLILHKRYPFMLGGVLCVLTIFAVLICYAAGVADKYLLTVVGSELLLYMLLNAISCLLVANMWKYVKTTIPVYITNLIIQFLVLYFILGASINDHKAFFPSLGALVFTFFSSMVLITVIRMVANFLKQE